MGFIDKIKYALKGPDPDHDAADAPPTELWSPKMGGEYAGFWDRMAQDRAGAYLAVAGEPFGQPATDESISKHGRDTAEILARVLELGPDDRVLEVGVGVGRIAEHLASRCQTFTGIDISKNMISIARERLARADNVRLEVADKSDLSMFADASFDKVYFQVVLIHLDREDAFHYMREARRVLAPGGRAWFQFYNLLHPGGFKEFEFAANYMVEHGAKTRGRVHCYTAPEVRTLVERAGLSINEDRSCLEPESQTFDFEIPDADWEFYLIAVGEKPADG